MTTRYERAPCSHIERPPDNTSVRLFISHDRVSGDPLVGARLGDVPRITLSIDEHDIPVVKRLLLKIQASELSDLRRTQTQLSVYGDRRASMAGEPAEIETRLAVISGLLAQIDA